MATTNLMIFAICSRIILSYLCISVNNSRKIFLTFLLFYLLKKKQKKKLPLPDTTTIVNDFSPILCSNCSVVTYSIYNGFLPSHVSSSTVGSYAQTKYDNMNVNTLSQLFKVSTFGLYRIGHTAALHFLLYMNKLQQ